MPTRNRQISARSNQPTRGGLVRSRPNGEFILGSALNVGSVLLSAPHHFSWAADMRCLYALYPARDWRDPMVACIRTAGREPKSRCVQPQRRAVPPRGRCAGLFEYAICTDAVRSIADPDLDASIESVKADPDVAAMQPPGHQLEVEHYHCCKYWMFDHALPQKGNIASGARNCFVHLVTLLDVSYLAGAGWTGPTAEIGENCPTVTSPEDTRS